MNDTNNITHNFEEMDLTKLTIPELLAKCKECGITKCKSKKKSELIELINTSKPKIAKLFIIEDDDEDENKIIDTLINEQNKIILTSNDSSNQFGGYEKEETYLADYLKTIKNKNGTYKRICLSPLRYAGGKSKAIGLILENLPKLREKKIVSPFFGGGSVELCLSQMLGINVIGYDIFNMLANFWYVLINFKDVFIDKLTKFNINEEEFTYNRHVLLNYWEKIKYN